MRLIPLVYAITDATWRYSGDERFTREQRAAGILKHLAEAGWSVVPTQQVETAREKYARQSGELARKLHRDLHGDGNEPGT